MDNVENDNEERELREALAVAAAAMEAYNRLARGRGRHNYLPPFRANLNFGQLPPPPPPPPLSPRLGAEGRGGMPGGANIATADIPLPAQAAAPAAPAVPVAPAVAVPAAPAPAAAAPAAAQKAVPVAVDNPCRWAARGVARGRTGRNRRGANGNWRRARSGRGRGG